MNRLVYVATMAAALVIARPVAAQSAATPSSNGVAKNGANGTVLAEIADIPQGPHVFTAVVAATNGAAAMLEWRDARNETTRWSQLIVVSPQGGTVTVPIDEPQAFQSGDHLRVELLGNTPGLVQATLAIQ